MIDTTEVVVVNECIQVFNPTSSINLQANLGTWKKTERNCQKTN